MIRTIFKPSETPTWNEKQNSLTGPVITGSFEKRAPALATARRSRLKGMPQKDLINIRNYDVRHLIPKICSAVLKNGAEILIESTVK